MPEASFSFPAQVYTLRIHPPSCLREPLTLQRARPSPPGHPENSGPGGCALGEEGEEPRPRCVSPAPTSPGRPRPEAPGWGPSAFLCSRMTALGRPFLPAPLPRTRGGGVRRWGGCAPALGPRWPGSPARGHFLRLSKRALSFLPNI